MAAPMIARKILAAIACAGLAAAATAHLIGNEPAAELIGNAAFVSLGLAALIPERVGKQSRLR
jgi:hypothetical protein